MMARARTIFATMLLALGACSGKSEPTVDSNRASDRDSADARSPDAILQARLQQAVRDIDKREARRGPDALFLRTGHALGLAGEMALAPPSAEPSAAAPNVRQGSSPASGRLPAEVVQRVVRANFGKLQACYETALRANPNLTARVKVAFTIGRDGTTGDVSETTDIDDKTFTSCIRAGFSSMSFPEPDGGVVRVTYPLQFTPDGVPAPRSSTATPPADFPPSPGAERERRKLADPMGPWPIVTVDKNHFRLDGESTGSSKETIESGKLHKVDALFEAMKKRREDWKAAHPDMSFPGVVGLRVEADVPVVAFKSAFQTLAYAGFPNVFVQSAADSEQIVEIAA
ncbi:MAG: AgmX/PglI C-terminal domain-containing protein, partial [Myxococcales bacterium]|nr:AgmX/PglI C-terminal domain-containing protein [Myxococcales bacterium]